MATLVRRPFKKSGHRETQWAGLVLDLHSHWVIYVSCWEQNAAVQPSVNYCKDSQLQTEKRCDIVQLNQSSNAHNATTQSFAHNVL